MADIIGKGSIKPNPVIVNMRKVSDPNSPSALNKANINPEVVQAIMQMNKAQREASRGSVSTSNHGPLTGSMKGMAYSNDGRPEILVVNQSIIEDANTPDPSVVQIKARNAPNILESVYSSNANNPLR